jgi:hypothetical protein
MLLESTPFWLFIFYAFIALVIASMWAIYRWLNRSQFRSEDGESIGVEYEENKLEQIIVYSKDNDVSDNDLDGQPHIAINTAH